MGLLRTAARAAVATRVVGNVHRRQQQQWAAQDAAAAAPPPAAAPVPPTSAPSTASVLDQLTQLGRLRESGVLNDAEFEAQKQRILAG